MKNKNNLYDRKIQKYNVGTYNRYTHSSIPINSAKHRNYYVSSEDEKTNSKSNNLLSDKNKTTSTQCKYGTKLLNSNAYAFSNSQKLFNDFEQQKEYYKSNNILGDNYSRISNHAYISLNSIIEGKNSKFLSPNNNESSIKNELEKKNNNSNNLNQPFIKRKSHQAFNHQSNSVTKDNSNNKYNDNYNNNMKGNKFNQSDKLIEYESNTTKSYRGKINTINEESEFNYNSKTNSTRHKDHKNNEKIAKVNYKNKSNILYNQAISKNNLYEKNIKGSRENNLNIKKNNNINNILNINKKNIINKIPNTKPNNDKRIINPTLKKTEFGKIKKLNHINVVNLSNLNDSSQKNIIDKNNHSFFEVKSLSRDFPHHQTEIVSESKKITMNIKNNNSVLDLSSSKKNIESNQKQYNNNINNNNNFSNNRQNLYQEKKNLFKLEDKKDSKDDIKENKINLIDLNKYKKKEGKRNILPKENKKSHSEIINKSIINNLNNNEIKFVKNKTNYKNVNTNYNYIKNNEKNIFTKNKINSRIKEIDNNRNSKQIEMFKSIYKYKLSKINSCIFNYLPISLKEHIKNKNNKKKKKFNSKKKLITLMNLNYKTFKEDFPIKIKSNIRNKYNKNLKPQIAFRTTLFNVVKPEKERYYFVNFFYSENIRNPIFIESDF